MTVDDFIRKYGTRAVSMLIRELAARKKDNAVAYEAADDLQKMLEGMIARDEWAGMTLSEAMRRGMNGGGG